jgi:hypothetical protein
MSYGHDSHFIESNTIEQIIREPSKDNPPRSVFGGWKAHGLSTIREIAPSTSWAKAIAANGLRSSYQPRAFRSSARAAAWKLRVIASVEFRANVLPRNQIDRSGIDLGHASRDLVRPSRFDVGLRTRFEGLNEQSSQGSPVSFWQFRRLLKQFLQVMVHIASIRRTQSEALLLIRALIPIAAQQHPEQRLLRVQPIFGLIEDY